MTNVLGIVAEYNPFHNGHLYHLAASKKRARADYTVAIISGNFVQRGNVSIVDKWTKAQMALACGIDLVIELPAIHSVSSAESFAYGAIKILNSLNIVDYISFGAETSDIDTLNKFAEVLYKEPSEFKSLLNHELSKGISFPKARENALLMYLNDIRKYANVLSSPNNILAIEYLKSLKKLKSPIRPITVKRQGAGYNDLNTIDKFASATAIREMIKNKNLADLQKCVPNTTFRTLYDSFKKGHFVKDISAFDKEILYTLRKMSIKEIKELPDVSEGLENAIKNAANSCNTVEELINIVKSKRYTQTRIQRILICALLNITKKDIALANKTEPYVRVLGVNNNGKKLLSAIRAESPRLNIITSVKKFVDTNTNKNIQAMLQKDFFATDVYTLGYSYDSWANLDYTHKLIISDF